MKQMTDVAGYIHREMTVNLDHKAAKRIHALHNPHWSQRLSTGNLDNIEAITIWRSMVAGGKKWDHKKDIIKEFGHWSYDRATKRRYNFDIWSNIHYGFIGKYAGFKDWTLKSGAGFAQVWAGTNPSGYWDRRTKKIADADALAAFDDPNDQVAIILGIELWGSHGRSLSLSQLIEAVRETCSELNTIEGSGLLGQCKIKPPIPPQLRLQPSQSFIKKPYIPPHQRFRK